MRKTKFKTWEEVRKSLNFTQLEEEQIRVERELIVTTTKAMKNSNAIKKS